MTKVKGRKEKRTSRETQNKIRIEERESRSKSRFERGFIAGGADLDRFIVLSRGVWRTGEGDLETSWFLRREAMLFIPLQDFWMVPFFFPSSMAKRSSKSLVLDCRRLSWYSADSSGSSLSSSLRLLQLSLCLGSRELISFEALRGALALAVHVDNTSPRFLRTMS